MAVNVLINQQSDASKLVSAETLLDKLLVHVFLCAFCCKIVY